MVSTIARDFLVFTILPWFVWRCFFGIDAGDFERRNVLRRTKKIWLDRFSELNWVARLYSPDVRSREITLVSYFIIFFKQKLIFDFHEILYAEDASINQP